jgi:hypothetical protein
MVTVVSCAKAIASTGDAAIFLSGVQGVLFPEINVTKCFSASPSALSVDSTFTGDPAWRSGNFYRCVGQRTVNSGSQEAVLIMDQINFYENENGNSGLRAVLNSRTGFAGNTNDFLDGGKFTIEDTVSERAFPTTAILIGDNRELTETAAFYLDQDATLLCVPFDPRPASPSRAFSPSAGFSSSAGFRPFAGHCGDIAGRCISPPLRNARSGDRGSGYVRLQ